MFILGLILPHYWARGFPGGSVVKNSPANAGDAGDAGDTGSIPGSGRSPGGGHGNPLQYSCLENSMDRGAWRATVHGVTKSQVQLGTEARLSEFQIMRFFSLGARIKPYIPGPLGLLGIFSLCLVGTRTPLWYSSPNSNCFGLPGLLVLAPQLRKPA